MYIYIHRYDVDIWLSYYIVLESYRGSDHDLGYIPQLRALGRSEEQGSSRDCYPP